VSGTLYVVATPIGNLEDVTLRALRVLKEVDWIACEDTRRSRKLLARHGIEGRLLSYHKFNERARVRVLLDHLANGEDVALVSDGGTPVLSDPGAILIAEAAAAGHRVVPVPGPSALAAAVSAAGLPAERVTFTGFLPSRAAHRRRALAALRDVPGLVVFLESPRRAAATLRDLAELWGERRAVLAREMTKLHEEFMRGTLRELAEKVGPGPLRGEVTLIVEGAEPGASARRGAGVGGRAGADARAGAAAGALLPAAGHAPGSLRELAALRREVDRRIREEGLRRSAAVRAVARAHALDARDLYRRLAGRAGGAPGAEESESEE
jgi:16S rRNA (cytidine1402-2'-O)-methyltransferase